MGVVEGWLIEGGGEELVLAVRRAVREEGGRVPGVVGLDDGLRGGEEGGARHFFFLVRCVFVSYGLCDLKSWTALVDSFRLIPVGALILAESRYVL